MAWPADVPPPPDWLDDEPPTKEEAEFAYWAFAPDDQDVPDDDDDTGSTWGAFETADWEESHFYL